MEFDLNVCFKFRLKIIPLSQPIYIFWSKVGPGVYLKNHNSSCFLFHQLWKIQIRQIYRSIVFDEDHCHILFNSSECVFELYFYYMTNYFSTYSVFSLTFDRFQRHSNFLKIWCNTYRLIACYFPKLYIKTENLITITLLIIQFSLTVGTHFYAYLGVPLAGYVPMCSYPPQLAIRFDTVNKVRTLVMSCCIVVTLTILYFNIKAEKR